MCNNFVRKVDKSQIPTCRILGVDIAAINMEWLVDFTNKHIKEIAGDYITVANVHTTVTAFEYENYRSIQNGGIMAIPDGGPLSTVAHMRGCKHISRTAGPSYMEEIFKISSEKGYRHFFLGSTDETLEKIQKNLNAKYPGLTIAGMFSPPFRPMTSEEDEAVIKMINDSEPDFVWIGLGAPKQEKWAFEHIGKVNGFMVGVGAGFDFFAGNIKRAPKWMQNCDLEWLYRLLQDPKRLLKRYLHSNISFIWNAVILNR